MMKRVACLWLPGWSLQRLDLVRPELKNQAVVFYQSRPRGGAHVTMVSRRARAWGVRCGMLLAEANSLAAGAGDTLHCQEHDPPADRQSLERLAVWCQRFSPTVGFEETAGPEEIDPPESLLLDITGCQRLFGGEPALGQRILSDLDRRGLMACVAMADTVGAAWAVAHDARQFESPRDQAIVIAPGQTAAALAPLPPALLRTGTEVSELLNQLGVERIEQLLALPRASLASRFGAPLARRLDQALGIVPEPIVPWRPSPLVQLSWPFEPPTERYETLVVVLERMIDYAADILRRRDRGAQRLELWLYPLAGPPIHLEVGLYRPSARARHLFELVRMQLERMRLPGSIEQLRLRVSMTARLEAHQQEMFPRGMGGADHRQLAALVDRLSGRLGRQAVLRAGLISDAQPEYACRYRPLLDGAAAQGRSAGRRLSPARKNKKRAAIRRAEADRGAGPRPLRLARRPIRLEVVSVVPAGPPIRFRYRGREHAIRRSIGPERIETGWWRGRVARRDYYTAETADGSRWWLFRRLSDGRWFLHGWFD